MIKLRAPKLKQFIDFLIEYFAVCGVPDPRQCLFVVTIGSTFDPNTCSGEISIFDLRVLRNKFFKCFEINKKPAFN